jgi:hypothetical protein
MIYLFDQTSLVCAPELNQLGTDRVRDRKSIPRRAVKSHNANKRKASIQNTAANWMAMNLISGSAARSLRMAAIETMMMHISVIFGTRILIRLL